VQPAPIPNNVVHAKLMKFEDILQYIVEHIFLAKYYYNAIIDFRKSQATKFTIEISLILLAFAYLGTLFSSEFIVYSSVNILLLLPGVVANNIVEKGYHALPPVVKENIIKIRAQIFSLLAKFNLSPELLWPDGIAKKQN